jgi:6-pyruvoyltetrahydropterin/6-carboxytetrahydropterin synthase
MGKFTSTKVFDGFSTVFRQWRAKDTHCSYLHGYGVSFKVWFEGTLDGRNWVWDFGGMKRAKGTIDGMSPKAWMDHMFDHTYIIAKDDPFLPEALKLDEAGVAQVRVVEATGAEKFSQFIYEKIAPFVEQETEGRVRVTKVEFREHEKNSAQYGE